MQKKKTKDKDIKKELQIFGKHQRKESLTGVKYWHTQGTFYINRQIIHFSNYTPLHYALEEGRLKLENLLLFKGVEVDAEDSFKSIPLICGRLMKVMSRHQLIIRQGEKINLQSIYNYIPLH